MRPVTPEEAERWTELAREHGYLSDEGEIVLGRFEVATVEQHGRSFEVTLRTVTPIVAGPKVPPLFDRTDAGEIIIPGRWFASLFEALAAGFGDDVLLPAETETIAVTAPDLRGGSITCEVLPPGGTIVVTIETG